MKLYRLVICILLVGYLSSTKAQGITPSTVRQVFSLEKGDSLEYLTYSMTMSEGCGELCDVYRLNIVDSLYYNAAQDTLIIFFNSQIIHADTFAKSPSYGCGECLSEFWSPDYFRLDAGKWVVPFLDSTIKYLTDTIYGTDCVFGYDTVYIHHTQYNGSRQNVYDYTDCSMAWFQEIYVDSIGIAYKTEQPGIQPDNTEQLIYYHKVNGKLWGTPYVYTGIKDVGNDYHISVYPNPVNDKFIIHSDIGTGIQFRLLDALSKQLMSFKLSSTETEVNRTILPPGIYFWQVTDNKRVIETGKLIIQ